MRHALQAGDQAQAAQWLAHCGMALVQTGDLLTLLAWRRQLQMFKQWHQMDPPDAEEKARNDKIASLQGNRNRFIDDPGQVELLITD